MSSLSHSWVLPNATDGAVLLFVSAHGCIRSISALPPGRKASIGEASTMEGKMPYHYDTQALMALTLTELMTLYQTLKSELEAMPAGSPAAD